MSTKYLALLTNVGTTKLANATVLGNRLAISQMAVGDGGGTLPTPDPAQTKLINEQRRAALNTLSVDPQNANQIIAEQVIPENEGGWWIREIGLYDTDGDLVAVANCAETYKPQLQEGSGRIQTVRVILAVSSTETVTLKIDPAVVLATRQYVDNTVIEVKAYTDNAFIEAKAYANNVLSEHVAAANPHKQYAPINSPALTGTPTAPTPVTGTNNTELATTEFVRSAIGDFSAKSFKNRLDVNGYQMLPSGLILQWGTLTIASVSTNIYATLPFLFPIAFPNVLCSISGLLRTGIPSGSYTSTSIENATKTGAEWYYVTGYTIAGGDISPTINWMAVGY